MSQHQGHGRACREPGRGQGEAGQDPSARPCALDAPPGPVLTLLSPRLGPSYLPAAKGSADSWWFPRVFRGYAERKRRKRENDSASVIQR